MDKPDKPNHFSEKIEAKNGQLLSFFCQLINQSFFWPFVCSVQNPFLLFSKDRRSSAKSEKVATVEFRVKTRGAKLCCKHFELNRVGMGKVLERQQASKNRTLEAVAAESRPTTLRGYALGILPNLLQQSMFLFPYFSMTQHWML